MKILFLLTFLVSTPISAMDFPRQDLYQCMEGNEDSICDQLIQFSTSSNGELTSIKVEYVGWCGSMGPYRYYCENNICEDAGLKFEFKDEKNYSWTNKQYGFKCRFEKK